MRLTEIQPPDILKFYIKKLNLKWKVHTFVSQVDTPRIDANYFMKEHRIMASVNHWSHLEDWLCDFVHELIHARLAERIDPMFAGCYFHPEYDSEDLKFQRRANLLHFAQSHVDVWVSDEMVVLLEDDGKRLIQSDIRTWEKAVRRLPPVLLKENGLAAICGWAIDWAQIVRNRWEKRYQREAYRILKKYRTAFNDDVVSKTKRLGQFWADIPSIPEQKEALELHSELTQKSIEILGLPIKAWIEYEQESPVWRVESV